MKNLTKIKNMNINANEENMDLNNEDKVEIEKYNRKLNMISLNNNNKSYRNINKLKESNKSYNENPKILNNEKSFGNSDNYLNNVEHEEYKSEAIKRKKF